MKLGVIESGSLTGKKVILEPRTDLPQNIYLVESGMSPIGPSYEHWCLACETQVPTEGCERCNHD